MGIRKTFLELLFLTLFNHNAMNEVTSKSTKPQSNDATQPVQNNITLNLRDQLMDFKNFRFMKNPPVCGGCQNKLLLIIIVHSSLVRIKKRTAIRETWGKPIDCVKVLFAMGTVYNRNALQVIDKEYQKHQDIIQGNFLDTYRNLTYKHVMALKWVVEHCKRARYLVKTDDDIMVIPRIMYEKLQNDEWGAKNLIACTVIQNARAQRKDSKWIVTETEYANDSYPDFCRGEFIIYSADVLHRLLEESYKVPPLWIDDVHVTGILASRIGVKPRNMNDTIWHLHNVRELLGPKELKPTNAIYGPSKLDPDEIYEVWKAIKVIEGLKKT